jgi:ferredoxin
MRITVDTDRCVGSAQCSRTEPRVFDQDDEYGTVVLLDPEPPPERYAAVRTAAHVCPVRAIEWFESGSNEPDKNVISNSVREGTAP